MLPAPDDLVYHPKAVAIGVRRDAGAMDDEIAALSEVRHLLTQANIAPAAIAGIFALDADASDPALHAMTRFLEVPIRFFTPADLVPVRPPQVVSAGDRLAAQTAAAMALTAVGEGGQLIPTPVSPPSAPYAYAMALAPAPIDALAIGQGRG